MTPPKPRISSKTRAAVDAMVDEGLSRAQASEAAGISDNWLYQQLRRPEVLAYRNQRREVLRTGEGARAIKRIADLAQSASSEAVKFDANRLLLATDPVEPIVPLQRSESTVNHRGLGPGLTIIMGTTEPPAITSTVCEVPFVSREKHLSAPIPHPASQLGGEFYGRKFTGGLAVVHPSKSGRDSGEDGDDG